MAIPKIIHRIWFGPKDMPDLYAKFGAEWQTMNPDWMVIDWNYQSMPKPINEWEFEQCGREWLPAAGDAKPATLVQVTQADILSYELLYHYGGLYLNTDMRPMQPLPKDFTEHDAVLANEVDDVLISNAFMAAEAQHPLMKSVIDAIPHSVKTEKRSVDWVTGPKLLTRIKQENYPETLTWPARYCNPWLASFKGIPHAESIAAHYWGHRTDDAILWPTD